MIRGFTYYIDIDLNSTHPVRLQSTEGIGGTLYGDGLTHSDGTTGTSAATNKESGRWTWTISFDAPDTLYYRCQYHDAMKGVFNIVDVRGPQGYQGYTGFQGLSLIHI